MARDKNLFTRSLYLTTEVSFLDTSTVAALFFCLISDWSLVRILTMLTLQSGYLLSFVFLCRQSGVRLPQTVYVAGMLLFPISIPYARIALYHMYYLPNITVMFWLMGLTVRLLRADKQKHACTWFLLVTTWMLAGLEGIRYMLILGMPMLVWLFFALLHTLKDYEWDNGRLNGPFPFRETDVFLLLCVMVASCAGFVVGFILNQYVLLPYYALGSSSHSWYWPQPQTQHYTEIILGWLKANGIRNSLAQLIGPRGVSIAACIACLGGLASISVRSLPAKRQERIEQDLVRGLYVTSFMTTTVVFLFDSLFRLYELYYVPVVALAYPALAQEINAMKERGAQASRKLILLITCACLMFQGAYSLFFIRADKTKLDAWDGLTYTEINTVDQVRDCIDFMQEKGYSHGMIDYWYASTMVELTDGKLTVAALDNKFESHTLPIYKWGTFKSDFAPEKLPDKIAVFIQRNQCKSFENSVPEAVLLHEGWIFNAYEADSSLVEQ